MLPKQALLARLSYTLMKENHMRLKIFCCDNNRLESEDPYIILEIPDGAWIECEKALKQCGIIGPESRKQGAPWKLYPWADLLIFCDPWQPISQLEKSG